MYGVPLTVMQRRLIMFFTLAAIIVYGVLYTSEAMRLPAVIAVRYVGIFILALLLMLLTKVFLWFNRRGGLTD
jgi:hypothetical protein